MFSTDQSHLRRYLTTLGVSVAAGTLSLAGLFLKLEQDLLVTRSTLLQLTPAARGTLLERQRYLAIGTSILPYFVLAGFLGGLGLAAYGLIGWNNRQKVSDAWEDLQLERGQVEFRQMTVQEQREELKREAEQSVAEVVQDQAEELKGEAEQAVAEVVQDQAEELKREAEQAAAETPKVEMPKNSSDTPESVRVASFQEQAMLLESNLVDKLESALGPDRVQAHLRSSRTRTGEIVSIDALANIRNVNIVFELKYSPFLKNVRNRIHDGLVALDRSVGAVKESGREIVMGALIVIVPDSADDSDLSRFNKYVKSHDEIHPRFTDRFYPRVTILMRYTEFLAVSAESLINSSMGPLSSEIG